MLGRARLRNDYHSPKIGQLDIKFLQEKIDLNKMAIFEGLKETLKEIKNDNDISNPVQP